MRIALCGLLAMACAAAPEDKKPTQVNGCVGVGFYLSDDISACKYHAPVTNDYPWDQECTLGWAECEMQPAGCETLPGFWVGRRGWYVWLGAENPGGCGPPFPGTSVNGYGCGRTMIRNQQFTCPGLWDSVSTHPWVDSVGILCCKKPYTAVKAWRSN